MKKDEIFFAADGQGLTSTSANHVANLAKEYVQERQSFADNVRFYSTELSLIGGTKDEIISKGYEEEDLQKIPQALSDIADATALIAWLREAIKARARLMSEAEDMTLEDFCKEQDIEVPMRPARPAPLTEEDCVGALTVKERNRYYALEAEAAVLGKYIHNSGPFSAARKEAQNKASNPTEVKGSGRDTLIYRYSSTIPSDVVEDAFFALQKKFREVQAELNSMKFEIQKQAKESEIEAANAYSEALSEYGEKIELLNSKLSARKLEETKRIGKLKIVIPNSLKGIYEKINNLDKKK